MKNFQYIVCASVLTVSCNAFGMFGMGRELCGEPSNAQQKEHKRTIRGLMYTKEENQQEYFDLLNSGNTQSERFLLLEKDAKIAQKIAHLSQLDVNSIKRNPQLNIAKGINTNTNFYTQRKTANINAPQRKFVMLSKNGFPTEVLAPRNRR